MKEQKVWGVIDGLSKDNELEISERRKNMSWKEKKGIREGQNKTEDEERGRAQGTIQEKRKVTMKKEDTRKEE